jgi:hypothetical protein
MKAIKVCSSDDFSFQKGKLIRLIQRKVNKKEKSVKKAVVKLFGKETAIPYDLAIKENFKIIRTI